MYKENMKINYCKIVQNEFVSSFIWDWKLDLVLYVWKESVNCSLQDDNTISVFPFLNIFR